MNFSYKVLSHKEHKVHKVCFSGFGKILITRILTVSDSRRLKSLLICLSNMENLNAVMIEDGVPQPERLNDIAIHQMRVLSADPTDRKLLK